MKEAYRHLERALQSWEAAAALHRAILPETPWRRLCFAQFHDILPGSSIHEVYAEILPELLSLADNARAETTRLLAEAHPGPCPCLFNPLALPRVVASGAKAFHLPPLSAIDISVHVLDLPPVEATPPAAPQHPPRRPL